MFTGVVHLIYTFGNNTALAINTKGAIMEITEAYEILNKYYPNIKEKYKIEKFDKALSKKQKPYSILDGINSKLYDGNVGLKDRFGFKIIK
jgi:hypothetical protein